MENLDNELKEIYNKKTQDETIQNDEPLETKDKIKNDIDTKNAETNDTQENVKIIKQEIKENQEPVESQTDAENTLSQDETKIDLPRGVKVTFLKDWENVPTEFKQEIKRSFEQKDSYITKLEEKNDELNRAINIAEVDIQDVVKQTGLPREQVIGNMLSWVSACQNDLDNTLMAAIQQGSISLKNPMGLIRFIANAHKLDLNEIVGIDPQQANLYDENLRLKLQQENYNKQLQYRQRLKEYEMERTIEKNIENFKYNHPELSSDIFASQEFQVDMSHAIQKIEINEPNNNNFLDILEKAYKIIENNGQTTDLSSQTTTQSLQEQNQVQTIKKPIATITKTTSIKSSTPTSRATPKQYNSKREMEADLEQDLKRIYNNK